MDDPENGAYLRGLERRSAGPSAIGLQRSELRSTVREDAASARNLDPSGT
jgi:hypothetical protein